MSHTSLKVIIGSIVQYDSGLDEWNYYFPSLAFSSQGNIMIENISFIDFTPFIYNPYGINSNRVLSIQNCDFKFCTRVSAFEITGGSPNDAWKPHAMATGTGINSVPTKLYGFKSLQYINNTFKYIHQSIIWGMPSAHDILIQDNIISENFSTLAYFVIIATALEGTHVRRCFNYQIMNNTFTACRIDSMREEDESILFQFYDDTKFTNNTFIDCYGIHCYISGDNTVIDGNVIQPYVNPNLAIGRNIYTSIRTRETTRSLRMYSVII